MDHPEIGGDSGIEPTIGEQLRLREAWQAIDRAGTEELRTLCKQLSEYAMVTMPAAMRWLVKQAASNLEGRPWSPEHSERLVAALELRSPEET